MIQNEAEVNRYLELMQKELEEEKLRRLDYQNQLSKASSFSSQNEQGLVQYQLDLGKDMDRIFHILSGDFIGVASDRSEVWMPSKDDRDRILSEYGVSQLMNIISFYINKNTLLSYYDDMDLITLKVHNFGIELIDLLFNKYEKFFYYPSPEQLYYKYLPYIKFTSINEDELYNECIKWSREELQEKYKHYQMIILLLTDTLHTTLLRAYGGKERDSLRKQTQIHQSVQENQQPQLNVNRSILPWKR